MIRSETIQIALSHFLCASFKHLAYEHALTCSAVDARAPKEKQKLIERYGEQDAWRGLATDDFQRAFDLMTALEAVFDAEAESTPNV